MDPITTAIIAALAALSQDVIKDSYNTLKAALKRKFGAESDLVDAVKKLEEKPDSDGRKTTLQEEIETAKVNEDEEILQLVRKLQQQINPEESTVSKFKTDFHSGVQGSQVGTQNKQENTFN